ncbi:hypothetical protein BWD08_09070 [Neisseria animaloris]|nr:hypothetical protein BWD08_09070 [Neisseria animaloris]
MVEQRTVIALRADGFDAVAVEVEYRRIDDVVFAVAIGVFVIIKCSISSLKSGSNSKCCKCS